MSTVADDNTTQEMVLAEVKFNEARPFGETNHLTYK